MRFEFVSGFAKVRKRKKTAVAVDEPRPSKPFAIVLSAAALAGCGSILMNAFFNLSADTANQKVFVEQTGSATAPAASQKTAPTITLKYDDLVEDIQRELAATGHFKGQVDGVTGPKTRVAIEAYQRDNDLQVTGDANAKLLEHIRYVRKLNQAAEITNSVSRAPAPAKPPVVPLAELPKAPVDNAIVKVQLRLAKLGYDPGSRSGVMDEGTRSAIMIFEMDNDLPMEGKISKQLLSALKLAEAKKKK
jgi:peptidoglycan hydrolase-like protein with peptidoglycan-binding domain